MTFSLANGMDVKAAEITEDSLVAAEDTNVGNESVDIQPVSYTHLDVYKRQLLYNLINMGVIVENFKNGEENYLCAVNMWCIVLADLYL